MKKIILPVFLATIALVGCGKDRTCTCTDSDSASTSTSTSTVTYVEVSNSQAKAKCVSSTSVEDGVTYKTECKLN